MRGEMIFLHNEKGFLPGEPFPYKYLIRDFPDHYPDYNKRDIKFFQRFFLFTYLQYQSSEEAE
jgi:hypothetical protein